MRGGYEKGEEKRRQERRGQEQRRSEKIGEEKRREEKRGGRGKEKEREEREREREGRGKGEERKGFAGEPTGGAVHFAPIATRSPGPGG
jgi:hypothetical protein